MIQRTCLVIVFCLIPFTAMSGRKAELTSLIGVNKGESLSVAIKNGRIEYSSKTGTNELICQDKTFLALKFSDEEVMSLNCGQVYGGIIRLQIPPNTKSKDGIVVAEDWGDEGCLKTMTAVIFVDEKNNVKITTKTVRSGKFVDGTKADCRPSTKTEKFRYSKKKKIFLKD